MEYPDSKQWVDNYIKAAATPIKGAAWNPTTEYNAVLALHRAAALIQRQAFRIHRPSIGDLVRPDTGAEYAAEMAMFSDKNLLTVKPLVGVDDAIKLLKEHIQGEGTRAAARF
jgi:hypothetical protein